MMIDLYTRILPIAIGEAVRACLFDGGRGRVLASVSRAVYLQTDEDALFWLAERGAPMHRRCLRLDGAVPRLEPGTSFFVRDGILEIGDDLHIYLGGADAWEWRAAPALCPSQTAGLEVQVNAVFLRLVGEAAPAGLGRFIPELVRRAQIRAVRLEPGLFADWSALREVQEACRARDLGLVFSCARKLIGLGPGLTPSGDDFLGGVFFILAMLSQNVTELRSWRDFPWSKNLVPWKPLTNPISFTLLRDHAEGHSLEPLHRFADGLFAGEPAERLLPHALALSQVGHSTGWDLLAGFLAGMSAARPG